MAHAVPQGEPGMHALRNPLNTRTVVVGGEHFLVGEDDTVVPVAGRPRA
jgi:hypothetical protein